jgi:NADH:ubiquinone oxidoreductase subunit E
VVAQRLSIPRGHVYALATFYRTFSLKPKGKYRVRVCLGTACHVHGGPTILESFERALGIKAGESTPDGTFSLEAASCLGRPSSLCASQRRAAQPGDACPRDRGGAELHRARQSGLGG